MQCPQCQYENLPDAIFCQECGEKIERVCPQCQTGNLPTAKFCRKCGTSLTQQSGARSLQFPIENRPDSRHRSLDPKPVSYTPQHLAEHIRAAQAAMEARGASEGERKTVTHVFADLKGSTALIEGLDPEEARAIIDPALQIMMDAVHRYEGFVAQALGDGIFALFGAPIAHEDHPQRALYAALRMQEEMRRYSDTLRAQGVRRC